MPEFDPTSTRRLQTMHTQHAAATLHRQLLQAGEAGLSLRGLCMLYGLAALPAGQEIAATELCQLAGLKPEASLSHTLQHLTPAQRAGFVAISLHTSGRRTLHRYRLTEAGRHWLTPPALRQAIQAKPTRP